MSRRKTVVFGGSVTAGTSAKLDVFHDCFQYQTTTVNKVRGTQTWWSILQRILADWVEDGVEVINAGVEGDTSSEGLARLERDVLCQEPDHVLVVFGVEDALQDVEMETFLQNLEKIVDGIAARNARPLVLTPTPISERMTAKGCTIYELRHRQDRLCDMAQAVRRLAERRSLPLIDLNRHFLDSHLAYDHLFEGRLPDGVAQSGMASFVAGELLPILGVKDFPKPSLCDYRKVYSDAEQPLTKHSGFTDLACFRGDFFLSFRAGARHGFRGLLGGKAVVLRSADGLNWVKDALLHVDGFNETRDPKFLQVGDRLMMYPVCRNPRVAEPLMDAVVYGFERLGPGRWGEPFVCAPGVFWRPRKWRDQFVVANYAWEFDAAMGRHFGVKLFRSSDGRTWEEHSTILGNETDGNETDLLVDGDVLVAFSRTEGASNDEMLISTYVPSENRWETVSSGRIVQAPNVFKVGHRTMIMGRYCSQSDDRFRALREDWSKFTNYVQKPDEEAHHTVAESARVDLARVEEYHHGLRTGVFAMHGTQPRLVMELLSAGDCSYTGLARYGNEYVISDYSMHEYYPEIRRPGDLVTPCDIYVSRIRFQE